MKINATIVLYNNDKLLLEKAINSFLNTELEVKIYLIDNSETDELKYLATLDDRIEYSFNGKNLGFGVAHNIALQKSIDDNIEFHLVLNQMFIMNVVLLKSYLSIWIKTMMLPM